jgi:hypothetical protein
MMDGGGYSAPSLSDALASFKAAEAATAPAATGYDALSDAALNKEVASLQAMQKQSPGNFRVGEELSMAKLAQDNRKSSGGTTTPKVTNLPFDTTTTPEVTNLPFDTTTNPEPTVLSGDGKILGENNTTVDNNLDGNVTTTTDNTNNGLTSTTDNSNTGFTQNKDASGTDYFQNPNLSPGAGGKGPEP